MLDELDRRILRQLQAIPDMSMPDLADMVGLSPARASRRVDRMQSVGVITGHQAIIDWRALGYAVHVSLRITLDKTMTRAFDDFLAAARAVPEVLEIQTFLGRVDVRLAVVALDLSDYQRLYRDRILILPHIADIEALMDVANVKSDRTVPL